MGVKTIRWGTTAKRVPRFWRWENDEDGGRALKDLRAFFACVPGAFMSENVR
jgi:hypothetical protein